MNSTKRVYVCLNEDCCKRGNRLIYDDLHRECVGLAGVEVCEYICFGNCENGANVVVYPDRVWFSGLRPENAAIVLGYLRTGMLPKGHAPEVDAELANTIYELLELQAAQCVSENVI